MKLYIILPDIHDKPPQGRSLKFKVYHPALICAEKVIQAYQPNGIIYLGDNTDMESLTYFDQNKPGLMEGRRYQKDIDSCKMMLDKHEKISKKSKKIFMFGNHEYRVKMYNEEHPTTKDKLDLIKDLELKERKYEIVPYMKLKKLGKAVFMHGYLASTNHSLAMTKNYPKTIFYGHSHDVQCSSFVSPIDSHEIRIAQSLGCLCDLNPAWLRGKPNKWMHSFGMFWLNTDGTFQMDVKMVIKGHTIVDGIVY